MILNNDVLHVIFKLLGPDYGLVLGLVCKDWYRVAALAWRGKRLLLSASALPVIPAKFHPNVTLTRRLPYELCASECHADLLDYIIDKDRPCGHPLWLYNTNLTMDPTIVEFVTGLLKMTRDDTPKLRVVTTRARYHSVLRGIIRALFGEVGLIMICIFTPCSHTITWVM